MLELTPLTEATSVCSRKLLVYEALSYCVCGLNLINVRTVMMSSLRPHALVGYGLIH